MASTDRDDLTREARRFRMLCPEPENYSAAGIEALGRLVDLDARTMTQDEFIDAAPGYDGLAVRIRTRVPAPTFSRTSQVKCILTPTTGLDHIDMNAALANGVEVFHLKGQLDVLREVPSTAEHTWALLLAVSRKLPAAFDSVRDGNWVQRPFRGNELSGKTLGILGYGRLGRMVAEYGKAFGMQVIAYDIAVVTGSDDVAVCTSMDELLRQASILSIHVPLNPDTYHMIGRRELDLLPDGALIVNTSRGDIVDEEALLAALGSGKIGGAGLDVIGNEEHFADNPILEYARHHGNVVVTPHIGGATEEAVEKTDFHILERFSAWLESSRRA